MSASDIYSHLAQVQSVLYDITRELYAVSRIEEDEDADYDMGSYARLYNLPTLDGAEALLERFIDMVMELFEIARDLGESLVEDEECVRQIGNDIEDLQAMVRPDEDPMYMELRELRERLEEGEPSHSDEFSESKQWDIEHAEWIAAVKANMSVRDAKVKIATRRLLDQLNKERQDSSDDA